MRIYALGHLGEIIMTESCPKMGKRAIALLPLRLFYSEDRTLESAVVRVINPGGQSDGELGFAESSSSLVLKELLREAPELITQQLAHLLRGEDGTVGVKTRSLMGWFWACSCRKSAIHSWVNNPFKDPGKLHQRGRE